MRRNIFFFVIQLTFLSEMVGTSPSVLCSLPAGAPPLHFSNRPVLSATYQLQALASVSCPFRSAHLPSFLLRLPAFFPLPSSVLRSVMHKIIGVPKFPFSFQASKGIGCTQFNCPVIQKRSDRSSRCWPKRIFYPNFCILPP